jgi:hypothetical protein
LKKLAFLGGAAGLGLMALLSSPVSQAADHLDSTSLATNPMADINDVYAWMSTDGSKINLALTVAPFDNGANEFGSAVSYAIHMTRYTYDSTSATVDFPASAAQLAAGEEHKLICTFAAANDGQCWLVDHTGKTLDYVKGDFTATAGKASAGGKLKVFAGRRSDPFFFNFAGFTAAKTDVTTACGASMDCPGAITTNPAGCPTLPSAVVAPIRAKLSATIPIAVGPCPANQKDCFLNANVMAIVAQVDKSLIVTDTKKLLSVWGSSHAAP